MTGSSTRTSRKDIMTRNAPGFERRYQGGFGNECAAEAVAGALPQGRTSPRRAPFDFYPELISGTAFAAPRYENRRSWMYRRQPSVGLVLDETASGVPVRKVVNATDAHLVWASGLAP